MNKKKHDILVLNKNYVPVQIVEWKTAMSLIIKDSAHAIDNTFVSYHFSDWMKFSISLDGMEYAKVQTVSQPIAIPEIIVLNRFDRLPDRDVKFSRENIFKVYNHKCAYCGKIFPQAQLTLDHILPRAFGGTTNWNNIVPSCKPCNAAKADKTLTQLGIKLLYKPMKPKWISPLNGIPWKDHPCKSWQHFFNRVEHN